MDEHGLFIDGLPFWNGDIPMAKAYLSIVLGKTSKANSFIESIGDSRKQPSGRPIFRVSS